MDSIDKRNRGHLYAQPSKVNRASLADQVASQLRTAIIHGHLEPGQRMVELDIAEQMGTSQGPVREALQRLEKDGLVERHSRSATYVTPICMEEMYELSLVRKTIESLAICHTATRITPAQCDQLQSLVDQMHKAMIGQDAIALVDCDTEFHRRICEWSGNTILLRAWTPLHYQIQRLIVASTSPYFQDPEQIVENHAPIVEALRGNSPEEAAKAIEESVMWFWTHMNRAEQVDN